MPRFRYKAYDANGAITAGELIVDSRAAALDALARKSQIPIALEEGNGEITQTPWWQREIAGTKRLSASQLAAFTRELSGLVSASLPLDEALRIVALQPSQSSKVRNLTRAVLARVTEGQSLAAALERTGGAFPEDYVRLIASGEVSGALGSVLEDLARHLERTTELRAKAASQLLYPAVLLVAAVAALIVITTVLVPAIRPIFEDAQATPPLIIRALSGLQAFLSENTLMLLIAAGILCAALMVAWRTPAARQWIDTALLKLPFVGALIQQSQTAQFARTLAALLRNGVPVTDAVRIAGGTLRNAAFRTAADAARVAIEQGSSLTAPLARSGLFPDLFLRLARVGEETGQMDAMLMRVAHSYETSVQQRVERLMTLLTPVLTLIIGGFVGSLIISVMNAILSVNELVLQ